MEIRMHGGNLTEIASNTYTLGFTLFTDVRDIVALVLENAHAQVMYHSNRNRKRQAIP